MNDISIRALPQLERLEDRLVLNAGALDPSFGIGGVVKVDFGGEGSAQQELIQPDGKVVLAGAVFVGPADARRTGELAIVRLLPNGALDPSFGSNGQITLPNGATSLVSFALQPDGKLLAVTPLGESLLFNFGFQITRLLPDGQIDSSFGADGSVKVQNITGGVLALQPDGKILIAGGDNVFDLEPSNLTISRLNADGTLDVTFGTDGMADTSLILGQAFGVGLQPDGHIVVAAGGAPTVYLRRFSSDGRLDLSFGSGGVATETDLLTGTMAIGPNGEIIVAGTKFGVVFGGIQVTRFTSNGDLDRTFGFDGRALLDNIASANSVALDSWGRIVVGGVSGREAEATNLLVGRLNPDGSKDLDFGFEGLVTGGIQHRVPGGTGTLAVSVQSNGSVVAAGYADGSSFAARYTSDNPLPTAEQRFVAQVYLDVLSRPAESTALTAWSGLLELGITRQAVSYLILNSPESRQKIVRNAYSEYLHRQPDQQGLFAWASYLAMGGTPTGLAIALASSPEFFDVEGASTADGFLDALYQSALNRSVDSAARLFWNQLFDQMGTTDQVAVAVFSSPEYRSDLVAEGYHTFLRREGDSGGIATSTQALDAGISDVILTSVLLGSDEYFHRNS
jgi:uncharacterized delta-60 repeat protein